MACNGSSIRPPMLMINATLRSLFKKTRVFQIGIYTAICVATIFLNGCATPVGIRSMSLEEANRKLTENVLSDGSLSAPTIQILNRFGLTKQFQAEPVKVLARLHKGHLTLNESDRLFALAELSFIYASHAEDKSFYAAAAIYAYAFLFPKDVSAVPNPVDPRFRTAIDIYNQGIAEFISSSQVDTAQRLKDVSHGVKKTGDSEERFMVKTLKLPFGEVTVTSKPEDIIWGGFLLDSFVRASTIDVRGLRNRYRWPGIGAAMVASLKPLEDVKHPASSKVPPALRIPITVFARFENLSEGLKSGHMQCRLEFYTPTSATFVTVDGRTMPIEYELSSALASTLEGSKVYEIELKGFFSGEYVLTRKRSASEDGLILMEPYRPNHIPLILVHGTASSPARWAEIINEVINDKELWGRYQFWLFTYNTGNPVLYSAGQLVTALRNAVKEFDPEGKDPDLRRMVIIGHSQGGLLTKFTAIHSGSKFWDNAYNEPFEKLEASPQTKQLLRRSMFYEPLPMVKRVIFMATPHRGSFIAGGFIGRTVGTFIKLPFEVLDPLKEVLAGNKDLATMRSIKDVPRSTGNMDPKSHFVRVFSSIPIDPGITAHSIIPVKNPEASKEKWTDGVVNFNSAHIDGVASELIIMGSGHSVQDNPEAIEEVRRILSEHLKESGN